MPFCTQRTARAGVLAISVALTGYLVWLTESSHAQPPTRENEPARGQRGGRGQKAPLDIKDIQLDTKDGVLMYGDGRIRPYAYTFREYVIRVSPSSPPGPEPGHEPVSIILPSTGPPSKRTTPGDEPIPV